MKPLVINVAIFGTGLGVFTLIRPYFKSIYEPRTYVLEPSKRITPLSLNMFFWPVAVFRADYRAIISANGLDAYFYVRFLRVMATIFLPIWFLSWTVLLPLTFVNASAQGYPNPGATTLAPSFTAPDPQAGYVGPLILMYLFTFWVLYNIRREMHHFIIKRQKHFVQRTPTKSIQSKTVLITGIPKKYLSQDALFKLFNKLPGGVQKIWINRNLQDLPAIYDRRTFACEKLETAETSLLRTATKLRLKAFNKSKSNNIVGVRNRHEDIESVGTLHEITVPESKRPTHRLGNIPFVGEKVDTIRWARREIEECTRLLEERRALIKESEELECESSDEDAECMLRQIGACDDGNPIVHGPRTTCEEERQLMGAFDIVAMGKQAVQAVAKGGGVIKDFLVRGGAAGKRPREHPPLNSAFVTFRGQIAAQLAVQVLAHHEPYQMSIRYVEVSPEDIIWSHLGMNNYRHMIHITLSWAMTIALIVPWVIPVALLNNISSTYALCAAVNFLAWICKFSSVIEGIISSTLPAILWAFLTKLTLIVLRLLVRFEGIPRYTSVELSLMPKYFLFQVMSSGIMGYLNDLKNTSTAPGSIPAILAANMSGASNFFAVFIIVQGLSGVAAGFLRIIPLIKYCTKFLLGGSTPRSMWNIKYGVDSVAWGSRFPNTTFLVVVTLGYSIISPIINGLACMTFFMLYQLYKYLFLYVYHQSRTTTDTGGLFYPKALQHIFVALYVQQICLCALFFRENWIPQGVLTVILTVLTAMFHIVINHMYGPLLVLPLSLQDRTLTEPVVEPQLAGPTNEGNINEDNSRHSSSATGLFDPVSSRGYRELEGNDEVADGDGPDDDDPQEREGKSAIFAHPATYMPQRRVWIPRDVYGLYLEEERQCRECGVRVTTRGAVMDEKGKVDVVL